MKLQTRMFLEDLFLFAFFMGPFIVIGISFVYTVIAKVVMPLLGL